MGIKIIFNENEIKEIIRLYLEEGLSMENISPIFNVCSTKIKKELIKNNISIKHKWAKDVKSKICKYCNEEKDLEKFVSETKICKECFSGHRRNKDYTFKKFGITKDDYINILKNQNYKCLICGIKHEELKSKRLAVDHNHITGEIRGLLCLKCNLSLGGFQDNIQYLENAIKYLKNNLENKG